MTSEDVRQELDKEPFVPLRFHLSSGKHMDVKYPGSAYLQQNTVLFLERLAPGSSRIGGYDVVALRLIERIEQISNGSKRRSIGRNKR